MFYGLLLRFLMYLIRRRAARNAERDRPQSTPG